MRTLLTALTVTTTLALAGAAAAQDRPRRAPDATYEFGDHIVDGGRYQPQQTSVLVRDPQTRESLVRPRVHFVPELLKSVEAI